MNSEAKARHDRSINFDQITFSGFSEQTEAQSQTMIQTFVDYYKQHKNEIAALDFSTKNPISAARSLWG